MKKEYVDKFYLEDSAKKLVNDKNAEEVEKAEEKLFSLAMQGVETDFLRLSINKDWSGKVFVFELKELPSDKFKKAFAEMLARKGVYDVKIIAVSDVVKDYSKAIKNKFICANYVSVERKEYGWRKNTYETTRTWETGSYTAKGETSLSWNVHEPVASTKVSVTPNTKSETTKHVEYIVEAEQITERKSYSVCCYGVYTETEYEHIITEINAFELMPNRSEYSRAKKYVKLGEQEYLNELSQKAVKSEEHVKKARFFTAVAMLLMLLCAIANAFFFNMNSTFLLPWSNWKGGLLWGLNVLTVTFYIFGAILGFPSGAYYVPICSVFQIILKLLNMLGTYLKGLSWSVLVLTRTIFDVIFKILVIMGFFGCLILALICLFLFFKSFYDFKQEKIRAKNEVSEEREIVSVIKEMLTNGNFEKLKAQRKLIVSLFDEYNKLKA